MRPWLKIAHAPLSKDRVYLVLLEDVPEEAYNSLAAQIQLTLRLTTTVVDVNLFEKQVKAIEIQAALKVFTVTYNFEMGMIILNLYLTSETARQIYIGMYLHG